jgi:integrase
MPRIKLRQDTVKTLPYVGVASDKTQCVYWDETFPGFGLRVFPNGRRGYVCSYRIQKRKRLAVLGRADVVTLEQARRKARIYLGRVSDGEDPQEMTDKIRASASVKTLIEKYLEHHAKPKKRSWKVDESALNRFVLPKFGAHLAASITTADIANLHAEIGQKHGYTANRLVAIIRKMFNVGRKLGLVPREIKNPATEIERFPEFKRRRYLAPVEMPRLAAAIDADMNEFAAHAIWLLLLTGIRRSEMLAAKWEDVDWEHRTLFVGKTKNGEPVLAPLSRAAIARLKIIPRLENNPYIVCGTIPGQPLIYLDAMWRRVRKETGLHDLRIHDLRRTVGSWLVKDGASLHLVGAVLNHKDQKTTAGYAYFQTQDRQKALDKHGKKVIDLATKHLPATRSIADSDSPGTGDTKIHTGRFAREELYDMVWSEPMTVLSKRLGISDVGFAKTCRRHGIPVPERGYWARIAAGQVANKEPLPGQQPGMREVIRIRVDRRGQKLKDADINLVSA